MGIAFSLLMASHVLRLGPNLPSTVSPEPQQAVVANQGE